MQDTVFWPQRAAVEPRNYLGSVRMTGKFLTPPPLPASVEPCLLLPSDVSFLPASLRAPRLFQKGRSSQRGVPLSGAR